MAALSIFPLSSFLLPQGKMRLRVFEPRYKRLVTTALKNERDFGVCLHDEALGQFPLNLTQMGTRAQIIDFYLLEDGFLGITIEGKECFQLKSMGVEADGLRVADVTFLPPRHDLIVSERFKPLQDELKKIYAISRSLNHLYDEKYFDSLNWVVDRWLEILPLDGQQVDQLSSLQSSAEIAEFICLFFQTEKNKSINLVNHLPKP